MRQYEYCALWALLLITVFFTWRSYTQPIKSSPCSVKKVFHHRGGGESQTLEVGSCVLYFDAVPEVVSHALTHSSVDKEVHTFFLPAVSLSGQDCKRMVARINKQTDTPYALSITQTDKPVKGMTISIEYLRDAYAIECKKFESIGRNKGLVFYIYNQDILRKLQNHQRPLTQTVFSRRCPPTIFIDNGHGGLDSGALSSSGIKEKDVCLSVGKYIASLLKENGYHVVLSRMKDQDISLDERTTLAHQVSADMFISIHANSAANNAHGVETFCLTPDLLKTVYSSLNYTDASTLVSCIKHKANQSKKLAKHIQSNVCQSIESLHDAGFDRGVKHAVAQVFFAHMPSVLVELGFLTNEKEAKLLTKNSYQKLLAQSVFNGIHNHFK